MRQSSQHVIAYKDLYDRYVVLYNTNTDTYSRYNVTAQGKYVLVCVGKTVEEVSHV